MTKDIFESWKNERFVVAPAALVDHEKLVILTDITFWSDNADALLDWCTVNGAENQGMTVVFPNEETLAMFLLRWS